MSDDLELTDIVEEQSGDKKQPDQAELRRRRLARFDNKPATNGVLRQEVDESRKGDAGDDPEESSETASDGDETASEDGETARPPPHVPRTQSGEPGESDIAFAAKKFRTDMGGFYKENAGATVGGGICFGVFCVLCLCVVFWVILGVILGGIKRVKYHEFGILYSTTTKSLKDEADGRVYDSGVYYVGVDHRFLKFPRFSKTIDYSDDMNFTPDLKEIQARSLDGVRIEIELSFQYQLIASSVYDVFANFSMSYEDMYEVTARVAILDTCSHFEAFDFIDRRADVGLAMRDAISAALLQHGASIVGFQLREVRVGETVNEAIVAKEVSRQTREARELSQLLAVAEARADLEVDTLLADAALIRSQAVHQAASLIAAAKAYEAETETEALKDGLNNIVAMTPLTAEHVASFLAIRALEEDQDDVTTIVNLKKPMIQDV